MAEQKSLKDNIKDTLDGNSVIINTRRVKEIYNTNKRLVYVDIGITLLVSVLISGYVSCLFLKLAHKIRDITLGDVIVQGMTPGISLILTIIVFVAINWFVVSMISGTHKNTVRDEDRNYNASKEGFHGTAMHMTDEERKEALIEGDYDTLTDNILGAQIDQPHKMYGVNYNRPTDGLNKNVAIIGSPGCGKTTCYIVPNIMQIIRRGESAIVTDPKGELYGKTSEMARAHGYVVKVLNFHQKMLLHSDSINFLSSAGKDVSLITAMAETVVANMFGDEKSDIWKAAETNLLKGAMLYIAYNDEGIPVNLASVYKLLNEHTVTEIQNIFDNIDEENPAIPYYNNFKTCPDTMKESIKGGLTIHLEALSDKKIQRITGIDDVDLSLPGKEKCIYYIVINDQNPKPLSWLVAMTFTMMFEALVGYADMIGGALPIAVTMLMDEFYNMGIIPGYDSKISQVRSRNIGCTLAVQSLAQLQDMYAESWEKILECCSTIIVMKVNSQGTADYFSKLSGEQTTEDASKRFYEKRMDPVKYHNEEQITSTHGQRMLYTSHEIRTLEPTHILVWISSRNVIELEKVNYFSHPMCKELRRCLTAAHTPDWIFSLTEKEQEKLGVYDDREMWQPEGDKKIELCTPEDFKTHWSKEKQAKLEKQIARWESQEGEGDEEEDIDEDMNEEEYTEEEDFADLYEEEQEEDICDVGEMFHV